MEVTEKYAADHVDGWDGVRAVATACFFILNPINFLEIVFAFS